MSSEKPRLSRKKRLAIFGIITIIGISIALYNAESSFQYKHTKTWDFDSYQNGTDPQGFAEMSTDKPGSWIVKSVSDAPSKPNVLEKLSQNNTSSTHLQVFPDSPTIDGGNVTMKFKIIPGQHGSSAGMLLRFMDDKHYFVLMADPVANRLSLCKNTPDFLICSYEKQVTITAGQWHIMKAVVSTQGVAAFLDDQLVIRANDHNYVSGQVGLWVKEDADAFFDDYKLEY